MMPPRFELIKSNFTFKMTYMQKNFVVSFPDNWAIQGYFSHIITVSFFYCLLPLLQIAIFTVPGNQSAFWKKSLLDALKVKKCI